MGASLQVCAPVDRLRFSFALLALFAGSRAEFCFLKCRLGVCLSHAEKTCMCPVCNLA